VCVRGCVFMCLCVHLTSQWPCSPPIESKAVCVRCVCVCVLVCVHLTSLWPCSPPLESKAACVCVCALRMCVLVCVHLTSLWPCSPPLESKAVRLWCICLFVCCTYMQNQEQQHEGSVFRTAAFTLRTLLSTHHLLATFINIPHCARY